MILEADTKLEENVDITREAVFKIDDLPEFNEGLKYYLDLNCQEDKRDSIWQLKQISL